MQIFCSFFYFFILFCKVEFTKSGYFSRVFLTERVTNARIYVRVRACACVYTKTRIHTYTYIYAFMPNLRANLAFKRLSRSIGTLIPFYDLRRLNARFCGQPIFASVNSATPLLHRASVHT